MTDKTPSLTGELPLQLASLTELKLTLTSTSEYRIS